MDTNKFFLFFFLPVSLSAVRKETDGFGDTNHIMNKREKFVGPEKNKN